MRKACILLFVMLACSVWPVVSASAKKVQLKKKAILQTGIRSILLDTSSLSVSLGNREICVDFSFIIREVNLSIVDSEGRQVYQEVVSPQTSSTTINLQDQDPGEYTIYFTDATGVCLFGSFVIQ